MATTKVKSSANQRKLEDYRAYQAEMLKISREYSQSRLAVWVEEALALNDTWNGFTQEWQTNLEQMTALAGSKFEEIAAQGEASAELLAQSWQQNLEQMTALTGSKFEEMAAQGGASAGLLAQSWQQNLADLSGSVDQWGDNFLNTLTKMASAWASTTGSQGSSGSGWSSLLGGVLDFGGWFHQGGVVSAHQGMVISPGTLIGDEQLIMAQAGEGVLPRESMARLGEKNFEALRTGRFDLSGGKAAPRFDVTIQVQSLDATGVAGLDWDRLVQRHLVPALRQEADSRW